MAIPTKLENYNVFIDGTNCLGLMKEVTLPKIKFKEEEYSACGMIGTIKLKGLLEAMTLECSVASIEEDFMQLVDKNDSVVTYKASYTNLNPDDQGVTVTVRGDWNGFENADADKSGSVVSNKLTCNVSYYKYEKDGDVLIEIDVNAPKYLKDGIDMLEARRKNLGLN